MIIWEKHGQSVNGLGRLGSNWTIWNKNLSLDSELRVS